MSSCLHPQASDSVLPVVEGEAEVCETAFTEQLGDVVLGRAGELADRLLEGAALDW